MRARKEDIHKACIRALTTFEAAEIKTGKFILRIIEDKWVRELKQVKTYYTLVGTVNLSPNSKRRVVDFMPMISSHCKTIFKVTILKAR